MALRIGVLMDPIATINTKKDTTLACFERRVLLVTISPTLNKLISL